MPKRIKKLFLTAIEIIFLIIFDRITKYLALKYLKNTAGIILIEGALKLTYIENRGAAFGILQGMQPLFWVLTVLFLAFSLWFFIRVPDNKHFIPVNTCLIFLVSGAIGNFIDRLTSGYVVDFIYFELINFPVFNVADIYVSLSVIALVLMFIFYYKDGDFDFIVKKN